MQAHLTNPIIYSIIMEEKNQELQSNELYKLMIYFAHSTLVMYSKTIVSDVNMSAADFMEQNKDVIKRVFAEGISLFRYELSHAQLTKACFVYLQAKYYPSSVSETEVYSVK